MSKSFGNFAATLFFTATALTVTGTGAVASDGLLAPQNAPSATTPHESFPDNVVCKAFDRTSYKVWHLRDRSTLDLGNWDGAFPITGAIEPGVFISKGIDLFDVLEIKCGLTADA